MACRPNEPVRRRVALKFAFAVMQTAQLRYTVRERDRADRITKFMTSMFKVSNPSEARGNSVTAREILNKASKDIDTELAKYPEMKAQMLDLRGTVYEGLGLLPTGRIAVEACSEHPSRCARNGTSRHSQFFQSAGSDFFRGR